MADDVARTVSFGGLFGRSFATFFSHIVPFYAIALVFGVPAYALMYALMATLGVDLATADPEQIEISTEQGLAIVLVLLIVLVAYLLIMAGTVNAAIRHLRGHQVSVADSLRMAMSRVGQVLLVSLLLYAIFVGVTLVAAVLAMVPFIGFVFVIAAIVFLFYLYLRWWVVIPTAVVESPGVLASFGRAAFLTKGHRWLILGFVLVFGLVVSIGVSVLSIVVTLPLALMGLGVLGEVLGTAIGVAAYSLMSIAAAVAYHDLRIEKEGGDGDRLATVFD